MRGRSKYKKELPTLIISNDRPDKIAKGHYVIADYDPQDNIITLWWRKHDHYAELTATLLHEYTHYLQFWPWYSRYSSIHPYSKNPYEIQAIQSETQTPLILRSISDRAWRSHLRRYPRLKKIYERASEWVFLES